MRIRTAASGSEKPTPKGAPAAIMTERQQTIVLDDNGDVKLLLGREGSAQQPIQAFKGAMSLASPVWKAMFNRVWAEHDVSEIALPDDDVEAMLLILQIAHLRFNELPKKDSLYLDPLVNLAVICDKCDLVHVVLPFLDRNDWARPWFDNNIQVNLYVELLFVAWTFGYSSDFQILADWAVQRLTVNSLQVPMISGKLFPTHMPPGLIERISKLRLGAIESILSSCYNNLELVLKGPLCKQNPPSEVDCRCMIMGSYVSFLIVKGLYPQRKDPVDITMSIHELRNIFSALEIRTHESHDYNALGKEIKEINQKSYHTVTQYTKDKLIGKGITEHKTCGEVVDIAAQVKKICSNIHSPVLDEHPTHMVAQAKK